MAGMLRIRPMVLLPLRDHAALGHHHLHDGNGDIFVPGHTRLASGTEVDLEIAFAREQLSIYSHGVVRWRRPSGNRRLPAGIGIELSKLDRRTGDLLRDFAAGRSVHLVRRASRRFPVELELDYSTAIEPRLAGTTYDLSRNGVAIIGSRAPAVGTRLHIHIEPPDIPELNLAGEVRWWRSVERGLFGVRFFLDDDRVARRVRQLIDRVKQELADKPTG